MNRCVICDAETANIFNLCDDCAATTTHAERVAQGFDPVERDPVRAARLAQRLSYTTVKKAS